EGARQLRAGNRPNAKDLLLTPANARRVTDQLATMRGAAMKVGQMLSMDTGDFLPRELADILAQLRSDARYMPAAQLDEVMGAAYGEDWESVLYGFDARPIAAASIGQVHRAISPDGREIALKVQYPGVARSIDSDVDNIAGLLQISGLLPDSLDIQPLLQEAKAQLHDEADYLKEAKFLTTFNELLADDERFILPEVLPELSHRNVLAMTFVAGKPIESVEKLPQQERDRVMTNLFDLMFLELFELRMVQTDPNFANYRYNAASGQIVLLDFGATRKFKAEFVRQYKRMAKAAMKGDVKTVVQAAQKLGYSMGDEGSEYRELMLEMFFMAMESLQTDEPYDFASSALTQEMAEMGERVMEFRDFWQAPPMDAVFFHRKLGGMFLLASRLKARVNVHRVLNAWL
ncbi:MAG: AarF/ABC1/UbiB kinase family protein, partial [Halioglobus sp.]|nr:AarF/ABC1/UbiB kinase family protein [Halioglobus sp.]